MRMPRRGRHDDLVRRLVSTARYEVLPTTSIQAQILRYVPVQRTLTVTASPRAGLRATVDLSIRLAKEGYDVVPHLAARMVRGRAELEELVGELTGAGIHRVFVPGGDAAPTPETYQSALELLTDLRLLGAPFDEVGITGYPESHPLISDDVTVQAMWDKRTLATHIVSNLCPRADTVVRWVERLHARGLLLPVHVGVPGPVDRARLVRMATRIGVAESARFLAGHRFVFARLTGPGGFRPERFIGGLTPLLERPDPAVAAIHLYTFNQVERAEQWRRRITRDLTDPAA